MATDVEPYSEEWVEEVLPTLTDAQAFEAFQVLVSDYDWTPQEIVPHLPRLSNALTSGYAGTDALTDEVMERLAMVDYAGFADPLLEAAADHALMIGERFSFVVLCITKNGDLHITQGLTGLLEPGPTAAELANLGTDRFALVTGQFGEVAVLIGCPTRRRDAVQAERWIEAGAARRGPWHDASPEAHDFIDEVMDHLTGQK